MRTSRLTRRKSSTSRATSMWASSSDISSLATRRRASVPHKSVITRRSYASGGVTRP